MRAALAAPFIFASHLSPAQQTSAARRRASSCGIVLRSLYVVAPNQATAPILRGPPGAPSFAAIMQKPEVDATYLRAFISVEHVSAKPPVVMPNLQLLDSERDAIVAYMLTFSANVDDRRRLRRDLCESHQHSHMKKP